MPGTMNTRVIRAEVVSAYSHCPRKAFLLHCTEDPGTPNDYACMLEERASANRASYFAKLQRTNTSTRSYTDEAISSGIELLTEANLKAANVAAYCDALRIVGQRGDPVAYEPTIVVGTYRPEKEQMLNLSVVGHVLEQLHGKPPATGCLITLDGECHRVNLRPMHKTVTSILERIRGWGGEPPTQPPPVVLNRHCPCCSFKNVCSQQAEGADDLSLLDRMTPKAIGRYQNKGIFTVKQLSFLFKPRRRRRRHAARPLHFDLEIQALAIRTGKIYIQTVPEIQRSDIELFLDIEGIPDRQFSYLIGLLIRDHQVSTHHVFWADTMEDEESIWRMLRMFTTGKAHFGVGAGIPLDWFWRARMVAAVERGGSRTGGRSAQGDGSVGTIASKMGGAERSNFTNWPKASLPCCQQVRKTLAKICCVRAPVAVRLPPQVLRAIAMSRIARSAKLLVACNPGQPKKVNRCGCSWRKWLASR